DERDLPAAAVAPSLAERKCVRQRLTRMLFVSQRIDHVKLPCGVGNDRGFLLRERPNHQGAHPTLEVACDIDERLANTFGKLGRQVQRVAAKFADGDLERGPRTE